MGLKLVLRQLLGLNRPLLKRLENLQRSVSPVGFDVTLRVLNDSRLEFWMNLLLLLRLLLLMMSAQLLVELLMMLLLLLLVLSDVNLFLFSGAPGVNPDVAFQVGFLEIGLRTLRTFERPLADVKPIVTSQIGLLLERLRTVVALMRA